MHELALARDLLEQVEQKLDSDRVCVLGIDITVGAAVGIVVDSLRLAFGILSEGTSAEGAKLTIKTLPARSHCIGCDNIFEFEGMIGNCPECGRLGGELLSGDEIMLCSIEVSDV